MVKVKPISFMLSPVISLDITWSSLQFIIIIVHGALSNSWFSAAQHVALKGVGCVSVGFKNNTFAT